MSANPATSRRSRKQAVPPEEDAEFFEKVVFINRCAKVVKGGRRFGFAALVVVGDQNGRVGFGYGKAKMVPESIRKGTDQAKKNMRTVSISGDTIPHKVLGKADGGKVLLIPARPGTGIIAGGGVRAVLEAAGVKNVLSKSLGSNNHLAVVTATMDGLKQLRTADRISVIRGEEVKGHPMTEVTNSSSQVFQSLSEEGSKTEKDPVEDSTESSSEVSSESSEQTSPEEESK